MSKIKEIRKIPSKIKEIKSVTENRSNLEEELDSDEDRQFSTFMSSGTALPILSPGGLGEGDVDFPRNEPGAPVISPDQEVEAPRSGTELYFIGQGLGNLTQGYISSATSSSTPLLRPRGFSEFSMSTPTSDLPESQAINLRRDALENNDLGSEKYSPTTPGAEAAKKSKYYGE